MLAAYSNRDFPDLTFCSSFTFEGVNAPKWREPARKSSCAGLAAMVLAIGIGLQGCSTPPIDVAIATETPEKMDTETPENRIEDIYRINIAGKWGYINAKGDLLANPPGMFDSVGKFAANGLALVHENGQSGFIDTKGRIAIPFVFEGASNFDDDGVASVCCKRKLSPDVRWDLKKGFFFDLIVKYSYYINAKGEEVVPVKKTQAAYARTYAYGLEPIQVNNKWGFVNAQGEKVISPRFDGVSEFADNGLAEFYEIRDGQQRWGFINTKGEIVIPSRLEKLIFDKDGYARFKENDKSGLFNSKGEVVFPPKFFYIGEFNDSGMALVWDNNNKYGYINTKGEIVAPPRFDMAEDFSPHGVARVQENGKYGYIDTKGVMVIPLSENDLVFDDMGFIMIRENGKEGFINSKGKVAIPPMFEWASSFERNGLAHVKKNGREFYINAEGKEVVFKNFEGDPSRIFKFDGDPSRIFSSLRAYKINGKWGFINDKYEIVIEPRFERESYFRHNGLAEVKENGKEGRYINVKGELIMSIEKVNGLQVLKNARGEIIWSQTK